MAIEFTPVAIEDLPEATRGRNGAGTNELVDSFMESSHTTVRVETGLEGKDGDELDAARKRTASVRSSASSYIERRELPVRLFTRGGAIYLHKDEAMPAQHAENKRKREAARAEKAKAEANQPAEVESTDSEDWAPEDSVLANA